MLVSILIPVFNRENYISDCIKSALNQTYENIEVILVDNASTDSTWDICSSLANTDQRLKIFRNNENIGPVPNWKRCIDESKGEFVKILFSDDLLDVKCIEKLLPLMKDDVGFAYSSVGVFTKNTETRELRYRYGETGAYKSHDYIFGALFKDNFPVSPGCAIFRRADFQKHLMLDVPNNINSDFSYHGIGSDLLLFLLVAKKYPNFGFINEVLCFFRDHEDSISTDSGVSRRILYYSLAKAYFVKEHFPTYSPLMTAYLLIVVKMFKSWDFGKETNLADFGFEKSSVKLRSLIRAFFLVLTRSLNRVKVKILHKLNSLIHIVKR